MFKGILSTLGLAPAAVEPPAPIIDDVGLSAGSAQGVYAAGNGYSPYNSFGYGVGSDGSKTPDGISGSGSPLYLNHRALRANGRRAMQDSPIARAFVDRMTDTVADSGIKIRMTPHADLLGITPEAAEAWAEDVTARLHLWLLSKDIHRSRTMTGYQLQRFYALNQQRDNDVFVRFFYDGDADSISKLEVEFIDPNQIYADAFTSTWGFNAFVDGGLADGIVRDSRGRETAYLIWVTDTDNPGAFKMVEVPARGPKSKRIFMLHGFTQEYPGQGRGYSRLAHALQEFQNLTDFTEATIQKAIMQASIAGIVEPSEDKDASDPFEDLREGQNVGPRSASAQYGANPNPSADAENVGDLAPITAYDIPAARINTPGQVVLTSLRSGEKFKSFENTSPGVAYDKFVEAYVSHLSASTGQPIEVVLMKFNANYSASRAALILFWRIAGIWRAEMDADFLTPLVEMWLTEEIAAGRIVARGWTNPRLRAAWLSHDLIAVPIPNIDPHKLSKAHKDQVDMGAASLDQVAHETNGSSAAANRSNLARSIPELTLTPWAKGTGGIEGARKEEDEEDEEE